jgi:hypothetical protein
MPHLPLLALDPGTIEAILALIGIVFWVLNKMLGQQAPPPARRPGAPPVGRPPQRPIARPPQQGQGDPLQSEIEEFLRRASGGRNPAGQQPGAQTATRPDPNRQQRGRQPLGRPDPRRGRPGQPSMPQTPPQPVAVAADPSQDTPEAMDRHVKQYLSTAEFDRRTSGLSTIDRQEQQFEKHLKDTFAHEVGHLRGGALAISGTSSVTSAAPPVAEGERRNFLALLLANPAELKTAVLLNEILPRPEHRW